ncbi:LexA family protein [uncultured Methylobacterium sp.]|uniref:LexA family protein n=1 Tax=uncultured Methylobacterium sp. TaxID=157278 RepID=UPI0035CC8B6C
MSLIPVDPLRSDGIDAVLVPILGQALCAGFPSPADDFLEGALELPRWLVPNPPATFLWQISGDSMRGAGIHDRDLACVDRSLTAGHDDVVVAAIDGQMSCKRYLLDGKAARLAFDNPDLPAFFLGEHGEAEIWGVVRFSIRWHVARGGLRR